MTKNAKINGLVEEFKESKQYANPKVFKTRFRMKCIDIDTKRSQVGSLLGCDLLRYAYTYAKGVLKRAKF